MHTRTLNVVLGASALLALGSSLAFAQAKPPTSTRRIPISKEGPAPVTRVDTVTVYKTDTLRIQGPTVTHTDTVRVTNTVTRVDTVAPPLPPVRVPNGVYFGLGAGVNLPEGAIYVPNAPGPFYQLQLGWQGAGQLLGVRLDGSYSKPGEDSQFSGFQADPDIMNGNLDLKLNLPWFHHLFGRRPYFTVYGIGGASYVRYKNLPMILDPGAPNPNAQAQFPNVRLGDYDWENKWGWNAGGGLSVALGRTEIFAESRVIQWTRDNTPSLRQVPIILGVNWFGGAR
jgi:opacity protein-like surface antigen